MVATPSAAGGWRLDQLPPDWLPALLPIGTDKRPHDPATGRRTGWPDWPAFSPQALDLAPAVGLRLGPISGGTLALDFDGPESKGTWVRIYGSRALPKSIAWTSGKQDRRQIAFKVPPHRWDELELRKAAEGSLEFRWAGQQSVIMGAHPETGSYRWVAGCAPWEVELAEAPAWLLDQMPRKAAPAPAPRPAAVPPALPAPVGDPVPFREFISKATTDLIETGSSEGSCNDDGLRLSLELVAVEAWLAQQGAAADETARDAYACYLSHCPDTIGGAPFDTATAWARFDGAADRQPRPSTPEEKLLQRLAFHRRKATRPTDKKVGPLRSQQPAQAAALDGSDELPYLPAIARGIPDGWIPRKDGPPSRAKIESGDLSGLLRRYFPGRLTFNLLTMAAEANGQEIKEADVDDCAVLLSEKGYKVTDQVNCAALLRVAREHSYDPVKQYLEAVAADSLLEPADLGAAAATYLNASDPLYSAMLRAWLIGAVARIFDPGCQMDYCLVLQSSVQGLFKSTFFKTLASPDWFTSSIPEAEKDFLLNVHRCWIFELAELDSYTSKRDAGRVKNIITTTTDFLRVPYGKATEPRLRRSVFASTCNRDDFLKDDTGSRRFWIIPITRKIYCNRVLQDRDAIWKAAVLAYRSGALPMLTDEQQAHSDDLNRGYAVQDPWMGMLVRWLRGESLMERRDGDPAPVSPEQPFTTAEALYSAGIRRPSAIGRSDETNLGPLLKELGFEKRRLSSGRDRAYRWFRREG